MDNSIRKNLLNWYPFEKDAKILEVRDNSEGEITEYLKTKVKKVDVIEKLDEINNKEKYDYILLIGSLPYIAKEENIKSKEIIKKISSLLTDNGKLLIAVNNRFGIRYFIGAEDGYLNKKFVTLLNYNNEEDKIETYTKDRMVKILEECGYFCHNFYYPLPDYKYPNVIFSDDAMPEYNNVDKYIPYYNENTNITVGEIDLFREILKCDKNLFPFFTNSYFIEASKSLQNIKYKYISFNNMRKKEYRLLTKIGNEYVEKEQIDKESKKHYENVINNIKLLKELKIDTVDEVVDKKVKSLFINNDNLLSKVLTKYLEEENIDGFYDLIDRYYSIIKSNFEKANEKDKNVFDKYDIDISEEQKKNLHFIKDGLWDFTFKNCFYVDDKFYFFDQEWKEENLPTEYILYRSIMYTISLRRFININDIIDKYKLNDYIDIFKELDEKLQEEIRDNDEWEQSKKVYLIDINATKQEMINMKIREHAKDLAMEELRKENDALRSQLQNFDNISLRTFIKKKIRRKK